MKISIVTLSFNQKKFLRTAIESVLNQNYDNLEYIIVDPGSTDGSKKIIQEYENYCNNIIFKPDSGPAEGLNNGFSEASGDIYGYLNSDDILYPGTLNRVKYYFAKYPKVDIISAHGHLINENNNIIKSIFSFKFDLQQYLYENCILVQQSTFFRSNLFKQSTGFNNNNNIAWDGELMVDFALAKGKFKVVHEYWSGFRIYQGSISGEGASYRQKLSEDYVRLRKKHGFPEINVFNRKIKWVWNWLRQPITLLKRIYCIIK